MDAADFARCLQRDDVAALVALPKVGRKTAERLLVEMRDKAGDWLEELSPTSEVQLSGKTRFPKAWITERKLSKRSSPSATN